MGGRGIGYTDNSKLKKDKIVLKDFNVTNKAIEKLRIQLKNEKLSNNKKYGKNGSLQLLSKYNIAAYSSVELADNMLVEKSFISLVKTLDRLSKTYNIDIIKDITKYNGAIKIHCWPFGYSSSGTFAATRSSKYIEEPYQIIMNLEMYTDYNMYIKQEKENVKSGWASDCDVENYVSHTMIHEFGHVLQDYIIKERIMKRDGIIDPTTYINLKKIEVNNIINELKEINNEKFNSEDNIISRYGNSKKSEFFPELFAELFLLGETKKTIVKSMDIFLKKIKRKENNNVYNRS